MLSKILKQAVVSEKNNNKKTKIYGKCFHTFFSALNKMLVIKAARKANREDPDQTASSDCLSRLYCSKF